MEALLISLHGLDKPVITYKEGKALHKRTIPCHHGACKPDILLSRFIPLNFVDLTHTLIQKSTLNFVGVGVSICRCMCRIVCVGIYISILHLCRMVCLDFYVCVCVCKCIYLYW